MSLMVNGKAVDWGDIDLGIPGLDLMEPQSIDYSDELEKELAYGLGNMPRGYGRGNYKAEAKLTVLKDDFDMLVKYCKSTGTPLYKLMFPKVTVSYADEGSSTKIDTINKVTITKAAHKMAQGDKTLSVELDLLVVGKINRDGVDPM